MKGDFCKVASIVVWIIIYLKAVGVDCVRLGA